MSKGDLLKIESDYYDFYDAQFAGRHADVPSWRRTSLGSRTRREDHALMRGVRLDVVEGRSVGKWAPNQEVVVYIYSKSHRGEGKRRCLAHEWGSTHPDLWASAWVGPPKGGESLRCVAIGRETRWLKYRSSNSWLSNVAEEGGDVEITAVLPEETHETSGLCRLSIEKLQYWLGEPLIAVDFVEDGEGRLKAIDLNTAPGLRGTPIEEMGASTTADLIAEGWFAIHGGIS
jgi:hypothetical protein